MTHHLKQVKFSLGIFLILAACLPLFGRTVPVPFVSRVVGTNAVSQGTTNWTGSASCTGLNGAAKVYVNGNGVAAHSFIGDGCDPKTVDLSGAYGVAMDAYGNIYFMDAQLNTTEAVGHRAVRIVYNGDDADGRIKRLIQAANSEILTSNGASTAPTVTSQTIDPRIGNIYTIGGAFSLPIPTNPDGSTYKPNATAPDDARVFLCYDGQAVGYPVAAVPNGDGCLATQAYLDAPKSIAVDGYGNVFVGDTGSGTAASMNRLEVIYNGDGSDAIAQMIMLINPAMFNRASTVGVGTSTSAVAPMAPIRGHMYPVALPSPATNGTINNPYGIAVDAYDNIFVADYANFSVTMINGPAASSSPWYDSNYPNAGQVHRVAGNCPANNTAACTSLGNGTPIPTLNGTPVLGTNAALVHPGAIALDSDGNIYVADGYGSAITINNTSVRIIYAGGATAKHLIETLYPGVTARTKYMYVLTSGVSQVPTASGNASTPATGNGGPATAAKPGMLTAVGVDSKGNVYFGDYANPSTLAKIDANTGTVTFLAGGGLYASAPAKVPSMTVTAGQNCGVAGSPAGGPAALDKFGNGCPGPQSVSYLIMGTIFIDAKGNVYYADGGVTLKTTNTTAVDTPRAQIRMLAAPGSFGSTPVGTPVTQWLAFTTADPGPVAVNGPPVALVQGVTGPDYRVMKENCTPSPLRNPVADGGQNNTCSVQVQFSPTVAGAIPGSLQVSAGGVTAAAPLSGTGLGAAIAIDPGTAGTPVGAAASTGVAVDLSGSNVYSVDALGNLYQSGTQIGSGLTAPRQVALDGAGNAYVANSGGGNIMEFAPGNAVGTALAITGLTSPTGIAIDANGNIYIADSGNVLKTALGSGTATALTTSSIGATALAVDGRGNVYAATSTGVVPVTSAGAQAALSGCTAPVSLAADAAGNVYCNDTATSAVVEIPVVGPGPVTLATGLTSTVSGIALDRNGNLYVADSAVAGVSRHNRAVSTQTITSGSITATLTSIGNQNYSPTAAATQTDATNFTLTTNGCDDYTTPLALTPGMTCAMTVAGSGSSTIVLAGNATNFGSVNLIVSGTTATTETTANLAVTGSTVGPVTAGMDVPTTNAVTFTATVKTNPAGTAVPAGGTVTFYNGAAVLGTGTTNASGIATYTAAANSLLAGPYSVAATYTTHGLYQTSTSAPAIVFTMVTQQPSTTTLTAPTSPVRGLAGTAITFAGTVTGGGTPAPTGTVAIMNGGTQVASGTLNISGAFSIPVSGLAVGGPYSLTAHYLGDTYNAVSDSSAVSVTVLNATTTALSVNKPSVPLGTALTFTANVTPAPATAGETVTFNYTGTASGSGTVTLNSSGKATFSTSSLGLGSYTFTATYGGDSANASSTSAPVSVTILNATTTALSVSPNPGVVGAPVMFTANVTPVPTTAGETVTFNYTGAASGSGTGTLNSSGAATFSTSGLRFGSYTVTATYGGDFANASSTSAPASVTIANPPFSTTTTTLSVSPSSAVVGAAVTFTATVAPAPATAGETVTFNYGGTAAGSATGTLDATGKATYSTSTLATGTYSVTVHYGGDMVYSASTSSSVPLTVWSTPPGIVLTPSSPSGITVTSGASGTMQLSLTPQGGYSGLGVLGCSNLPAHMTCLFNPKTLSFDGSGKAVTAALVVGTVDSGQVSELSSPTPMGRTWPPALCFLLLPGIFGGVLRFRRKGLRQRYMALLLIVAAGFVGASLMSGCGGSSSPKTVAGTYSIAVTVTASGKAAQAIPITVTVQ
jgi:hypothetical protein